ncbi:hypothetical protein DPX16_21103 [Anabarilius grahami]|uniref:Uncharacterized protein n=1 Tax=Anabarilius grahami TaxID=495550 RepID=A0A3N0YKH0_ANAGA|nr:hypothetical protein DPX16_21103 [Anabarilius grahami]
MELHPEYDVCGARPKRHIRPPVRYADYEVDYRGYIGERYREELESTHQEGNARMTPLTSPYDSSLRLQRRDAILQEMDLGYRAENQQPSQKNQLAPQRFPEREFREQLRDYSTPLPSVLHPIHPQEESRVELDDIRHERHLLQQTQLDMASDLVELRALQADMKQLVDAVRNMQSPTSIHTRKPELTVMSPRPPVEREPKAEEEDDWPAPPPWPDPELDEPLPSDPPIAHSLISRIDEHQPQLLTCLWASHKLITQHVRPFLRPGHGRTLPVIHLPGSSPFSSCRSHSDYLQLSPSTLLFMVVNGVSLAST